MNINTPNKSDFLKYDISCILFLSPTALPNNVSTPIGAKDRALIAFTKANPKPI